MRAEWLEGSEGRRAHVWGLSSCPPEGSHMTLAYEGRKYDDYEVTFAGPTSRRHGGDGSVYDALVVRDSESLP